MDLNDEQKNVIISYKIQLNYVILLVLQWL